MKFYVASRFTNYTTVRTVVDHLTLMMNHRCTYDWTRTPQFNGLGVLVVPESSLTQKQKADHAYADLQGALEADVIVLLCKPDMAGSFIEVGLALSRGAQVYVIGGCRPTIFWALPNVTRFAVVEHLYQHLDAYGS